MNPIFFNCLLLYLIVVSLSLLQSRFKVFKEGPLFFLFTVFVMPFLVLGKLSKGGRMITWVELTSFEVFTFTLMMAYLSTKHILPKVNEGYIYAYTLFHWYLLADTINITGLNFWLIIVIIISVYPTFLIIKTSLEHKVLERRNKIILYYWFLFTIIFTYVDQVALDIIKPVLQLTNISFANSIIVLVSAAQVYFISTVLSLLFVAIPIFHLDRSSRSFKVRWKEAKEECRDILEHKLDNYIEYQVSTVQVFNITVFSGVLFWIDATSDFRPYLIFIYTVVMPLVFFYFKWSPENNVEMD
jgi:hypothetical protein